MRGIPNLISAAFILAAEQSSVDANESACHGWFDADCSADLINGQVEVAVGVRLQCDGDLCFGEHDQRRLFAERVSRSATSRAASGLSPSGSPCLRRVRAYHSLISGSIFIAGIPFDIARPVPPQPCTELLGHCRLGVTCRRTLTEPYASLDADSVWRLVSHAWDSLSYEMAALRKSIRCGEVNVLLIPFDSVGPACSTQWSR